MNQKKDVFSLGNAYENMLGNIEEVNKYDYNEEEYVIDINQKNNAHAAVIRQIDSNCEVLDIGCARGLIGKYLKDVKNCVVDGIEYDKEAYKIAKNKNIYRDLFNFSIADLASKDYKSFENLNKKYDFIIFADVLEHLVEPWVVLKNVSKFLKPKGSIIVSIPNIAHIDIIKGLINGDFNYAEFGILDSTHLRFFTACSFIQMVKSIAKNSQVYFDICLCEKVLNKPGYVDKTFEIFNCENNFDEFLVLQNIFKLTLVEKESYVHKKVIAKNNYFEVFKEKCNNILEENQILKNRLNQIENSKRWKFINKIGNWKNKIFRR